MGVNELCIIGVLSEMHIWSMADGAVSITTITNIPVFGPQSWNKTSINHLGALCGHLKLRSHSTP